MKKKEPIAENFDVMAWKEKVSESVSVTLSAEPDVIRKRVEEARRQFVGQRKPTGRSRKTV